MDSGRGPSIEIRVLPLLDGAVEIDLRGELDESNLADVRAHLLDHSAGEPNRILLDVSRLDAIDSAGLALLLLARIEIEASGGSFVVQATRPRVRRAFERAHMARFVQVVGSRAEALAVLGSRTAIS